MQFYPENPHVKVHPLQGTGELRYVLSCPQTHIAKKDFTIKYAFAGKWNVASQALKTRIRDILVQVLDVSCFDVKPIASKWIISVPLKVLANPGLLPNQGNIEIPLVIKLSKKDTPTSQGFQLKCYQTMSMDTKINGDSTEFVGESYLDLPEHESPEDSDDPELAAAQTVKMSSVSKMMAAIMPELVLPGEPVPAEDVPPVATKAETKPLSSLAATSRIPGIPSAMLKKFATPDTTTPGLESEKTSEALSSKALLETVIPESGSEKTSASSTPKSSSSRHGTVIIPLGNASPLPSVKAAAAYPGSSPATSKTTSPLPSIPSKSAPISPTSSHTTATSTAKASTSSGAISTIGIVPASTQTKSIPSGIPDDLLLPDTNAGDLVIATPPAPVVETENKPPEVYSGIMAIDFGTTNSVVVVRDPRYAAEEIKADLSREQWQTLIQWLNSWVIQHLSVLAPNEQDLFVEEITRYVPEMDISPCGSLSVDLWEDLQHITPDVKIKFLSEMLANFSTFDSENNNPKILKDLTSEVMSGLERSVYSKTLESQRYFILELDENAGPGPISSALQIVSAPISKDQEELYHQTQIEMGVRVHLLMRSAALREADIRQFVMTIKRYFGQEQKITLVPAESDGTLVQFDPDILCRLAYQTLIQRSLRDIKNRSLIGELKYADAIRTIVATFPTTYPASLRRKLRDMMNELEVQDIDTRFDEGTASALYYIWRDVCADPVCGMHGIMARCRQDRHGRSYQNLLLYDLGGGTTDIALLQLVYEELPIFEPLDKTKSEGGRYFRITPKLLGATGHRYIGGDLITLWLLRLVKAKIVDRLFSLMKEHHVHPPAGSAIATVLTNLPDEFCDNDGNYRCPTLLHWARQPHSNLRRYEQINNQILNPIIPTKFAEENANTANFFILWDITEAAKKQLGTPISTYAGSGLGSEWPTEITLDAAQLEKMILSLHPWLEKCPDINRDDWKITISQHELSVCAEQPVFDSINLSINLAKARLKVGDYTDRIDRLIFSGLSCNLQVVQTQAKKLFQKTEGLFDFSLANVFFEPELAKTSVAMGACIGRYLESVRLDPTHEKTRQMLREGYDQVELVVENLFTNLACKLVYDSLVAMVAIFDHGQELNQRSFIDGKPVARTTMDDLRPVQEKFWVYRVDFEGAQPQYLGLINSEAVAYKNGFDDFRKFREQYLVGFEADAELYIRAFFLPRGPKNIIALSYLEDKSFQLPGRPFLQEDNYGYCILQKAVSSQELFNRRVIIPANTKMVDTIEYPDGSRYRCALSQALPMREMYDFYIENRTEENEPHLLSHFHLDEVEVEEVTLACDETGRVVLLLAKIYDIKIWAEIDYVPQKVDAQYDPFCGEH